MKPIFKRILSGVLSTIMAINAVPFVSANAEESAEVYPYTMFAASSDDGAITINASNFCVNGNLATNGTIISDGNMNVNGTKTENADESMIFIFDKIDKCYFSGSNVEEHDEDYILDELNININVPTEIEGEATLTGNININNALKALENVNLYGEVKNTNNSVIFSKYGDIVIDSQNVNLNGLVYAPFGSVKINAQNLNLNNVVIIAESIVLTCPNVNANNSVNASSFVGTISEEAEYIHISDNNMIHRFGNEYTTGVNFNGFSGIVALSDLVEDFKINVYDKNHTQIYTHEITPEFNWIVENVGMLYGTNYVEFIVNYQDRFTYSKEIVVNCDLLNLSDYISIDMNDDDGDGLVNYLESYFGTNKDNPDSDYDGLSDNIEVAILSTDPLKKDTDNNGIFDGDEDFDMDSLTNLKEIEIGSSPIDVDTDDDRLLDNEEIEYGASLSDSDTDHDGISDYDEIRFGLSPLNADNINGTLTTTFNADIMCDEYDIASIPSVELSGDLACISSFKMKLFDNPLIASSSMPGFVGEAYSFTTDTAFDSAKVTFTLDYDRIEGSNEEDFDPVLYWLNEETNTFEEVSGQVRNGNKIEANLEHFSTYIVINRTAFLSKWFSNYSISEDEFYYGDNYKNKSQKKVLFLIDQSGSMNSSDTNNIKTHIMDDFVNSISSEDCISVVGFNHNNLDYLSFESDKEKIRQALDDLEKSGNSGGTNIGYALEQNYDAFSFNPENVYQCIFLISDGDSSDSPSDELLKKYKEKGVKIFTVGLGTLSIKAEKELERIAEQTNGQYYSVKQSSLLRATLIDLDKKLSVDKDKNKDNIEDYYEYLMCNGELLTTTNEEICYGLYDSLINRGEDYDGDGLKNGDEIKIVSVNGELKVKVLTHPLFNDTDGDGYLDGEEVEIGSDPNLIEDYIYMQDINTVGKNMCAEIAADDYINSNFALMIGERFLDVYVCGGEFDIQKMYQSVMVDYVAYFDDLTFDQDVSAGWASNILTETQRGMQLYNSKITNKGALTKEYERMTDFINQSRLLFNKFRNTENYKKGINGTRELYKNWTKEYRAAKKYCKNLDSTIDKSNRATRGSKILGKGATVFCYASYTLDDAIDGLTLYSNTYNATLFTKLFDDLHITVMTRILLMQHK